MPQLTQASRIELVDLARSAVEATAANRARPNLEPGDCSPELAAPAAAFVTLHEQGRLRGCIGMLRHEVALWINVRDAAIAAARDDPRFAPVEASELSEIEIEVSVLERPVAIADHSLFEAGRHGIVVERGGCRALLLPQVAAEMGWGEAEMLAAVCRKAGLAPGAWRDPETQLYVFESTCFGAASS